MIFLDSILLATALSMDAFTVAISGGANTSKLNLKNAFTIALYFGGFQFLMPIIGWTFGKYFDKYISSFDHWVAFALLLFIGGKMIAEYFKKEKDENISFNHKLLFILAIATSIDALGVGLSLALINKSILFSAIIIGIITFSFSAFGFYLGKQLKKIIQNKAELFGGVTLIGIGINILVNHGVFRQIII